VGRGVFFVVVALGALRDPGCDTSTVPTGLNGACTRDKDCESGLVCRGGACVNEDAGNPPDSGGDGSDAGVGHADASD
jgi:hypothetical protein